MVEAASPELPQLIVVQAFDRDDEGVLFSAFGPEQQQSEDRAIRTARALATKHVGAIAWCREASPAIGEYGEPTVLFTAGDIPDME
ncbi:hypothetical protein [Oryzicola mucosus]|uniref:Uncharacterized protein n=1 Tax=Oryzicola mucosus TaxID=2767425 RepID=A0A8J6PLU9_9HYPH|nr:hypothetical protein [Oryzicola mucosus]MBD0416883.1 hypothetical protein [Oryzicola mucosus]